MATVGALVDRVIREWLHGGDEQPVLLTLDGALTASATSVSYSDATLAPDEEELLAPGVLVEVGTEQMRITAVDETANSLTVVRGVNGTTAASHTDGDTITVAPTYSRGAVFEAVCDAVVGLYPDLWDVTSTSITSASGYVDIPAEVTFIDKAFYISGGNRPVDASIRFEPEFPPSATGKAIIFNGTPAGKTVHLIYSARFARPTSESDDLADFGVKPEWERIIAVAAAAQVVAGTDLDPVTAEYITEQLEREGYPVGSSQRIRDGLLRYYRFLVDEAHRNLRADRPVPVVMHL